MPSKKKSPVSPVSPTPIPLEHRHRLVMVHWVDSSSRRGVWNTLEELQQDNVCLECVSVGFVMNETKDILTVACHLTPMQGGGDMTIPVCAITKIQTIGYLPRKK